MTKILIIDDNEDMLKMMQMIIGKKTNYRVVACKDGSEGLEAAFESQPEIAIVDVMMPGISGYEVVQQLRKTPRTADMGIIILTARGQAIDRTAALEAGADDHMSKPVKMDALIERIGSLLEEKEEEKQRKKVTAAAATDRTRQKQAQAAPKEERAGYLTLALFSLRGGVGVTTLAVNLASVLQEVGSTLLLDLSPNSGHCALNLGLRPEKHWGNYLENPNTPFESLLLSHASGLRLLAAPLVPLEYGWFSNDDIKKLLTQLKPTCRFLVLDMPPVLNPTAKYLLTQANFVLLVSGDDPSSLQTTMMTRTAISDCASRTLLIRNITTPGPHPSAEAVKRALHTKTLIDIPYEKAQTQAQRAGTPLALSQPQASMVAPLKRTIQLLLARKKKAT
ncbi:MAG: response regulator [Chloroflexi bacterium]|jgi:DNA-binding response OmpR family regulator|nr:response regulator [Chloroflexota bacterium]